MVVNLWQSAEAKAHDGETFISYVRKEVSIYSAGGAKSVLTDVQNPAQTYGLDNSPRPETLDPETDSETSPGAALLVIYHLNDCELPLSI